LQPGTRLDHYEIIDLIGEGGMGAVYRAEDTRLKRQVAIKVCRRNWPPIRSVWRGSNARRNFWLR